MRNSLIHMILICCIPAAAFAYSPSMPADSVGLIRYNGKSYILHKVDKGQTMYSLTRRYGTTIAAIKDANPGLADQITESETIRVPYTPPARSAAVKETPKENKPAEKPPVAAAPVASKPAAGGIHKVEVGQTLYSIAGRYGVSMDDIRKWNGMQTDNVILGQEIIVSERIYNDRKPAKVVTAVSADTTKVKAPVAEKVVKPVETPAEEPKAVETHTVRETGLAEIIDVNESTSTKYLALHRTAPIGSLIEVKNEFNQESIWVKVIGRIPDTSVNQDIVIKLSGRAFEKISPNTRRFRAAISYKVVK